MNMDFERLQRWMLDVIRHPGGAGEGVAAAAPLHGFEQLALEELILPSHSLSAVQRLDIYADMYRQRLFDTLAKDFPALCHCLGRDGFDGLMIEFVSAHPPHSHSLLHLSDPLLDWLEREAAWVPERELVLELAKLEQALLHCFHAPRVPTQNVSSLEDIPAGDLLEICFEPVPSARVFAFEYEVDPFLQAVTEAWEPEPARKAPNYLLVHRVQYQVWRRPLADSAGRLLMELFAGRNLGQALEACLQACGESPEELLGQTRTWFQEWTEYGLFQSISTQDT